ncbi:MAG TPA: hypothetical protein VMU50_19340 [Polyangia bacterium]|nr:hypothetical protein [Polyangia bacterium]
MAFSACGKKGGTANKESTFGATFSNATGTNASTGALQLVFESTGANGTVTASAAYLVVNGTGGMTIIWSDGGSPKRTITIDTSGTPAAGATYNTDAAQTPTGANTFTYKEDQELWDGTGTINIVSVDEKSTLLDFTAHMAMQPDATSPGGATGTFTIDVTSTSAVFGL